MKAKHLSAAKIVIIIGAVIVLVAVSAFLYAVIKGEKLTASGAEALGHIEKLIPARENSVIGENEVTVMPAVSYKGEDYCAIIELPAHGAKLPVRKKWDADDAKYIPCVFAGTVYDGTLCIGSSDTEGAFDFIADIDIGETVYITDMKGCVFRFTVKGVKHADSADAQTVCDKNSKLTFFAKDRRSGDTLVVKCE